jgi:4'-phosphopantetheinyl transferase
MSVEAHKHRVSNWLPPPASFSLDDKDVHIWQMRLDQSPEVQSECDDILSADQRVRANRFYFAEHRNHFITCRDFLRRILARYLNTSAREIELAYTKYGKPSLAGDHAHTGLRFNLSHSYGVALYGITCNREIGVDVEHVCHDIDFDGIARRFFAPSEYEHCVGFRQTIGSQLFFAVGLARRPYIKATGQY